MPIYEYVCKSCQKKFDQLERTMSSDSKAKCPECGSSKTARALSVFAVGGEPSSKGTIEQDSPACGRCGEAPGSCGM